MSETVSHHASAALPAFALSQRARRSTDQPISYLMAQAVANPRIISLAAGLVDYDTLPADAMQTLVERVLEDPNRARTALQYGTTEGLASLRQKLYHHMATLDGIDEKQFPGSAEQVIITTGSQQLLHVLTELLVDADDIVITAWPTYFVYTGALTTFGARVCTVQMDEQGMIPESLDATLAALRKAGELPRVKIVYICDYHQNPTGITLSAERRPMIYDIVQRYAREQRILILEDAAYRELTYRPRGKGDQAIDVPASMKSLDKDNQCVALLQTFSKPFAPGLKTGYGLLPDDLVEPVLLNKGARDFGSNNFTQHLLDEAFQTRVYHQHVQQLCQAYAKKRDAMLDALDHHLTGIAPDIHWTQPTGGLYVWLTLPPTIDTGSKGPLFHHAIQQGVLFVPGEYCYPNDPTRTVPHNTMRLSFGVSNPQQIEHGIARLAKAIREVMKK